MSIKAIVFDKDGTLIDYPSYWYYVGMAATERAYRMLGITDIPDGELEAHVRELGVTEAYTDIEGSLPLGDHKGIVEALYRHVQMLGKQPSIEECIAAFSASYSAEDVKRKGNICPTTDKLAVALRELKARGICLALVTSDDELGARMCLNSLGVTDCFDKIIGYRSGIRAKPAPDLMLAFLAERGFCADEVIMVGDTRTDVSFAKNSGTVSVGVGKDERSRELLFSYGADYVLRDLSAIPSLLDTL